MTEQTKIPMPSEGGNSIERAVEKFELGKFNPPPMPGGLESRRPRRPVRLPTIDLALAANPAPAPAAAAPAAAAPVATAPVATAPVAAPVVQASTPGPAPQPEPEAARFSGRQHPVDRKRLREQGLIVPEGAVTALLEEYRIVKRQLLLNASDLRRQGSGAAAQRILVSSLHGPRPDIRHSASRSSG
jgi:pyruvate/2-oxoglutarate dehydrogenase complex dihydrolipoamide acyltransferase (E2) component